MTLSRVLGPLLLCSMFALPALGCSSAKITSSWSVPGTEGAKLKNILVVGITKDAAVRRNFEAKFVEALKAQGASAAISIDAIGESVPVTEDTVKAVASQGGFDAVLTTHLVGREERVEYTEGDFDAGAPQNTFHGYYPRVYGYVSAPGYYEKNTYVHLESNVFLSETAKMIWTAQTEAFAEEDAHTLIGDVVTVVAKKLKNDGLIGG